MSDTSINVHMINNSGFIWNTDGKNIKSIYYNLFNF